MMKKKWKRGMALMTGLAMTVSMAPGVFANETEDSVTSWSSLYASMGVDTASGYDAVTSATNFSGYHAKDIPSVVHRSSDESGQTVLDGVTLNEVESTVTPKLASASYAYSSSYGSGEFDIVPDDTVEGYVWNEYQTKLYAVTVSDGTTTVGAVPWIDYYGEPATSGPHYNKVQVAINNGTSKGSNKAEVARYAPFFDENNAMKAGTYTVTLYAEGYEPLSADVEVLPTYGKEISTDTVRANSTVITVKNLPSDISNAKATVSYSYTKEGERRPTTVYLAQNVSLGSKYNILKTIALEESLEEYEGKELTITINSDNYAPMTTTCTVQKHIAVNPTPTPDPEPTPVPDPEPVPTPDPEPTPSVINFEDVSDGAYFHDAVYWAVEKAITKGTSETTFSPEKSCTRAEAVMFLYRAAGSPETTAASGCTDVTDSAYYAKAVSWALQNGITKGISDTAFGPDQVCTRAQIVTFLSRFAGVTEKSSESSFDDVSSDAYYASAVQWAVDHEITYGVSDKLFGPDQSCTRAQIVTFLYRYLN